MKGRIYRYVVRVDAGAAPNPFAGWCSLAICKPGIRKTAQIDDWVIGQRSRMPNHLIYVMQVQERLSFAEFWKDPRFRDKRADRCASSDNIYRPSSNGQLVQVPNLVHDQRDTERDTGGRNVLVSERFWYFGDKSAKVPDDLAHLLHHGRGHSLHINRRDGDIDLLERWLASQPAGLRGAPIDIDILRPLQCARPANPCGVARRSGPPTIPPTTFGQCC